MRIRYGRLFIESCPLPIRGGGFTVDTYVTRHRDPVDSLVRYFPSGKVFSTEEIATEYGIQVGKQAVDSGLMPL
ncbi:MAG TPA: hypothetical protein VE957_09900 [Terriglobales bacterium]|nr:hypothetical protein [Terriglobales bacterium]